MPTPVLPAASFLVVQGRPVVLVDVDPAAVAGQAAAADAPLWNNLRAGGLRPIAGHDADLHTAQGLRWLLDVRGLRLVTRDDIALLTVGRAQLDDDWAMEAEGSGSVTVVAGTGLALDADTSQGDLLRRVDRAARSGTVVRGRVVLHRTRAGGAADLFTPGTGVGPGPVRPTARGRRSASTSPSRRAGVDATIAAATRPTGGRGPAPDPTPSTGTTTSPRRWATMLRVSPGARLGVLASTAVLITAFVGQQVAGPAQDDTSDPSAILVPLDDGDASPSAEPPPAVAPGSPAAWVVAGPDGAPVRASAGAEVDEVAAAGLTWPIIEEVDDGYMVATHCDRDAWVDAIDVTRPNVDRGAGLAGAVVVVDAGHGGADPGAVGPGGLLESDVNLEVAERLGALLARSNDVDPATGAVTPGDQHPPIAAVVMTRDRQDDTGGDQRTSLTFRGRMSTLVDADALLSIHHNAGGVETFDQPATEVFYSVDDDPSPRLAGLVVEELRRSLAPLADSWRGATLAGGIGRTGEDGSDWYTVLHASDVPAVISEAAYMTTQAGEALVSTDEFQQAEAEGLYRALVRFLDTDEQGAEVEPPFWWQVDGGEQRDYADCSMAPTD